MEDIIRLNVELIEYLQLSMVRLASLGVLCIKLGRRHTHPDLTFLRLYLFLPISVVLN